MSGSPMRIIAGAFKGTRLKAPKSQHIRPTSDRVREFIFSCIQMEIVDAEVLDLFAGTGALGLEALSRGASRVLFVDNSNLAVDLIKQNLDVIKSNAPIHRQSAEAYLKTTDQQFDFIFCDPPYNFPRFDLVLQLVVQQNLLKENGTLVYESSSRQAPIHQPGLKIIRQKKMGDTLITFYEKESSNLSRDV